MGICFNIVDEKGEDITVTAGLKFGKRNTTEIMWYQNNT